VTVLVGRGSGKRCWEQPPSSNQTKNSQFNDPEDEARVVLALAVGNKSVEVKCNNSEVTQDKSLATKLGVVTLTYMEKDEDGENVRITRALHRGAHGKNHSVEVGQTNQVRWKECEDVCLAQDLGARSEGLILESMREVGDKEKILNSLSPTKDAGGKGHLVEGGC
jgi:hypothetical protein